MSGCAVCGDKVNGTRYGAPACLGCIVFFRRAVCKKAQYKCLKQHACNITNESRCICRYCRLQKCLTVGMNPDSIQRRDIMGPRKKKSHDEEVSQPSPQPSCSSNSSFSSPQAALCGNPDSSHMMQKLIRLQKRQRSEHLSTACMIDDTIDFGADVFKNIALLTKNPPFRRARQRDVNFMLRVSLMDASEWANQFDPFRKLCHDMKKAILSEFGLAFMLVDEGVATAAIGSDEYWMLQNNTYMSPDYLKGLPKEDARLKEVPTKAKLHPIFVEDAIQSVGKPMKHMQIDEFESAVLKTILLLAHSSSTDKNFFGNEHKEAVAELQARIINELMDYCRKKSPQNAIERMGAVLLLTSSIRCSIRSLYNQTRISDVFNLMTFSSLIKDVYLS